MTETEAIAKVRKLLALAANAGTEAEAALAADRAQAILTDYKLEAARVALDPSVAHVSDPVAETQHSFAQGAKRMDPWQVRLIGAVASVHYCKLVLLPARREGAGFTLIGKSLDRQVASETFDYLRETVQRLTRAYEPTGLAMTGDEVTLTGGALRKARTAFALGCAAEIGERLRATFKARVAVSAETTALVVTSKTEVEATTKRIYPHLVSHRTNATGWGRVDHTTAGRDAGRNVGLTPQRKIGGGAVQRRIV